MVKHIFLTGEKQIGKSTLLKKVRRRIYDHFQWDEAGFETRPYFVNGICKGFVFHSLTEKDVYRNDYPITIRTAEKGMQSIGWSFDVAAAAMLKEAREAGWSHPLVWVMDEIGRAETEARIFRREIHCCLDEAPCCIGVLQKHAAFSQEIAQRRDVKVFEVTRENRDELEPVIWELFCLQVMRIGGIPLRE